MCYGKYVGCSGYEMFGMRDFGSVGCCGCEILEMWDIVDVGC